MQMRISQPERIQEVSEQTRILSILFRSPARLALRVVVDIVIILVVTLLWYIWAD